MKAQLQDGRLILEADGRGGTVLVYVRGRVEQWTERGGVMVLGSGLPAGDGKWSSEPALAMDWNGAGMAEEHERKVVR